MALIKRLEHGSGASAEYWRVIEVALNYYANIGGIALAGYVDKAARDAGKQPLDSRQVSIPSEAMPLFAVDELSKDTINPVKVAYNFIKAAKPAEGQPANPFADAVDA